MNAVGIDVSKGKSMVTILRPFVEIVSSKVTRMRRAVIQLQSHQQIQLPHCCYC